LEQSMLEGMRPSELGSQILMDQNSIEAVLASLKDSVERVEAAGNSAVLVCAPALRPAIRRLVSAQNGGLPVLSYQEVTSAQVNIETVGVVRVAESISA
jgi:flagellar biosynthesis protein FlhA